MKWYCVQTVTNREKQCEMDLTCAGYENYLPVSKKDKNRQRLNDNMPVPYYPGYMFIRLEEGLHDFHEVKSIKTVVNILKTGNHYTPVPDSAIEFMRSMENEQGIIVGEHAAYQKGEKVRFKEGHKFAMYEGLIHISRKKRLFVLLEIMGKQQQIPVKPQDIDIVA